MAALKTRVAYVRLSPRDHAAIADGARRAGLSVSGFLRHAGLNLPLSSRVPAVNRAAWSDLTLTAANLNQLAHHLNQARASGRFGNFDPEPLRADLRRMYGHITALRRLLIGEAGQRSRISPSATAFAVSSNTISTRPRATSSATRP